MIKSLCPASRRVLSHLMTYYLLNEILKLNNKKQMMDLYWFGKIYIQLHTFLKDSFLLLWKLYAMAGFWLTFSSTWAFLLIYRMGLSRKFLLFSRYDYHVLYISTINIKTCLGGIFFGISSLCAYILPCVRVLVCVCACMVLVSLVCVCSCVFT